MGKLRMMERPAFDQRFYGFFHRADKIRSNGRISFKRLAKLGKSIGRFNVPLVEIHGEFAVDNSKRCNPIFVMTPEDINVTIEFYVSHFLQVHTNYFFFAWEWPVWHSVESAHRTQSPRIRLYRVTGPENKPVDPIEMLKENLAFLKKPKESAEQSPINGKDFWKIEGDYLTTRELFFDQPIRSCDLGAMNSFYGGCTVFLDSLVIMPWDEKLIEENYAMMNKDMLLGIDRDLDHRLFVERSVIAAIHKVQELTQTMHQAEVEQNHDSEYVLLETRGIAGDAEIRWKFKKTTTVKLEGRRREGGFGSETGVPVGDEILVVDSFRNGVTVDRIEPGRTYYFTFLMKFRSDGEWKMYDMVRFSLTLPQPTDLFNMLEDRLAELQRAGRPPLPPPPKPDPEEERRKTLFDRVFRDIGTKVTLEKERARHIAATRQLPEFLALDEEKQNNCITYINKKFDNLEEDLEQKFRVL